MRAGWKPLVLLLILALAMRLGMALWWQSRAEGQFIFPDSQTYWALGTTIAQGQPYRYGPEQAAVFRTPGYPLLLAPIIALAGDGPAAVLLARVESALWGTLAVALVWWLARELSGGRAGLLAAAAAAVLPEAVAASGLVLSEAPFGALMLAQLAFSTVAWKAERPSRAALAALAAGLAAGAATLVRPSWLLFTPAAAVVLSASTRGVTAGRFGKRLVLASAMIAGLIAAMLPWWARNYRLTGSFVPTTLQVGASLYDGLNPKATGASNMDLVPRTMGEKRLPLPDAHINREVSLDRHLRAMALDWARCNPGQALRLAGVKFLRMWNVWPNEPSLSSPVVRLVVLWTYAPVVILGLIGAAWTWRHGWPYLLCWLPAVYFTMLHVVFVGSIRYRQPAMFGLIILAAGAIEIMTNAERQTTKSRAE